MLRVCLSACPFASVTLVDLDHRVQLCKNVEMGTYQDRSMSWLDDLHAEADPDRGIL